MRRPGAPRAAARALAVLLAAGCGGTDDSAAPPPREPTAQTSVEPARARVAEVVELTISATHPAGVEAKFPQVGAELEGLEVVKAGRVRSRHLEPGVDVTERVVKLRAFRPGAHTLGPFTIALASEGGLAGTVTAPAAQVEIRSDVSAASGLDDLRPAQGPFELHPEPVRWGLVLAVAAGVLVAAGAGAWGYRRARARHRDAHRAAPPVPADEVALGKLRQIRESGILEQGLVARYTDEVSDVLRQYLESRFSLPAPERTTEEFLDVMAREPVLDRERKKFLADYLAQCDLVKFAAEDPGRRELEELYDASVRFVQTTAEGRRAARAEG